MNNSSFVTVLLVCSILDCFDFLFNIVVGGIGIANRLLLYTSNAIVARLVAAADLKSTAVIQIIIRY